MAFFRDPGEMFLGCLGTVEQRFLVTLIETAAQFGYTRFVEPCAGTSPWQTWLSVPGSSRSRLRQAMCP